MSISSEPRSSMVKGEGVKDPVRCSECGVMLLTLKDHIQKEDSFVCASCYQSMIYGHRTAGIEPVE